MSKETARLRAQIDQHRAAFAELWNLVEPAQKARVFKSAASTKVSYPATDLQLLHAAALLHLLEAIVSSLEAVEMEGRDRRQRKPRDD